MNWHKITIDHAKKVIKAAENKKPVDNLEDFAEELMVTSKEAQFENVVGQDSLTRFDRPKKKNNRRKKRNNRNNKKKRSGKNV